MKHSRLAWFGVALLSIVHVGLLVASSRVNSVTIDEFAHLPAGLAYWKYQEWSIYNLSPPTLRMLVSWPALLARPEIPDAAKFRKYVREAGTGFMPKRFSAAIRIGFIRYS